MPAVTFDATGTNSVAAGTTVAVTMTVGSASNRAVMVGLSFGVNTVSNISVSGGGATNWQVVQGTDTGGLATVRTVLWAGRAPSSGSQTFTASWTGASDCIMGVVTVSGTVSGAPSVVNGVSQTAIATTSNTLVVLTGTFNLPMDVVANLSTLTSPTQTQRWNDATQATVTGGGSTAAAGGTSASFGWTSGAATTWAHSGATFIAQAEDPGGGGDEGSELVRARLLSAGVAPADWSPPILTQTWSRLDEDITTPPPPLPVDDETGTTGVTPADWSPPMPTQTWARLDEDIPTVPPLQVDTDIAAPGGIGPAIESGSSVTFAPAMDDLDAGTIPAPTLVDDDPDVPGVAPGLIARRGLQGIQVFLLGAADELARQVGTWSDEGGPLYLPAPIPNIILAMLPGIQPEGFNVPIPPPPPGAGLRVLLRGLGTAPVYGSLADLSAAKIVYVLLRFDAAYPAGGYLLAPSALGFTTQALTFLSTTAMLKAQGYFPVYDGVTGAVRLFRVQAGRWIEAAAGADLSTVLLDVAVTGS